MESISSDQIVIVIGGNHHNTLGVLRSLGRKGIHSILILVTHENKPYVGYSKYIKDKIIVKDSTNAINYLKSNYKNETTKPIVIGCYDEIAELLDKEKYKLEKYFHIPYASNINGLEYWMNKDNMANLAKTIGFNIPNCWHIAPQSEILPEIEFPCITKPLISKNGSKADIIICQNKNELNNYLKSRKNQEIQIQKFIDKDFEYQLIGCSLNSGQEIIIPGVSKIIHSPSCTNTGSLYYLNLDSSYNLDFCKKFIQHIGYSGLFSLEFIRGKDGKDYFMEMNFRNDGNSICVTYAGVNLPYIWYLYNSGLDYKSEIHNKINELYIIPEFCILGLALSKKISFKECITDFRSAQYYMEYDKNDKRPFLKYLINYLQVLSKNLFNKIIRYDFSKFIRYNKK